MGGIAATQKEQRLIEAELLGELLANGMGRDDELSGNLIAQHGSLATLLQRCAHDGLGAAGLPDNSRRKLMALSQALSHAWRCEAFEAPVLSSSEALHRFLTFDMGQLATENFRVLFLDRANRLLDDRVFWTGTVDQVQVHPREVVRHALAVESSAIIAVHNHPGGQRDPSGDDVRLTTRLVHACQALDIAVHDHLIVTESGCTSMRRTGHLPTDGQPRGLAA